MSLETLVNVSRDFGECLCTMLNVSEEILMAHVQASIRRLRISQCAAAFTPKICKKIRLELGAWRFPG